MQYTKCVQKKSSVFTKQCSIRLFVLCQTGDMVCVCVCVCLSVRLHQSESVCTLCVLISFSFHLIFRLAISVSTTCNICGVFSSVNYLKQCKSHRNINNVFFPRGHEDCRQSSSTYALSCLYVMKTSRHNSTQTWN